MPQTEGTGREDGDDGEREAFRELLTDDLGITTRPANALVEMFNSEAGLVDALRDGRKVSDVGGVGNRTANKVWDWLKSEHPDAYRERLENDPAYCTEFTADHGIPDDRLEDGETYFAFVCPRCETTNPLKGNPDGFRNKPFRCENCMWVPLLEGGALVEFAESEGVAA